MKIKSATFFLFTLLCFSLLGCSGGSDFYAGIGSGGIIAGRVLANSSGGYAGYAPLANVYVVAQREDGDGLIRSTRTDYNGNYRFDGLPLGTWRLGFEAQGYTNIPVTNSSIVAYSEVGSTFTVYDVYLQGTASYGDSYVVINLRSSATGQAISGATVMVGPSSGVTGYTGEVTLSVPVRIDSATGQPMAESILVLASGTDGSTVSPS